MDGVVDGKGEEKVITEAKRDPTYFLDWDFIFLKVEDTLFRIPRYHLLKHLHPGDLFNSPSPQCAEGYSEAKPFVVPDDISVNDFRHFLRIILPQETENLEAFWSKKTAKVSRNEWISVLKISTLWRCLKLRKLAIRELEATSNRPPLTAVEKIVLGRKHSISSWVASGYKMMVAATRPSMITDEEMQEIGAVESFKLMRIIHGHCYFGLNDQVEGIFQEELQSITAAEKAYL